MCNGGRQAGLADALAHLFKQLTILGLFDGFKPGAQDFALTFAQDTLLRQLHGKVKPRLSAQRRHNGIGAFFADDFGDVFQRQRFHIHFVGDMGVGHNRGGV